MEPKAPEPTRMSALGEALWVGLAYAASDALASGLLRLPPTLLLASLVLGLLVGLATGLTAAIGGRPRLGGSLALALLAGLQGAALASKGLEEGARTAGFLLAALSGLVALIPSRHGSPWVGAALLPLGAGLAAAPSPWVGLGLGALACAVPQLPPRARRALLLTGLAAAALLHRQRPAPQPLVTRPPASAPAAHGPNVVLLVIDTLRADELPPEGNLARFAREGVRFEQCTSSAPWTLPSVSSLLTARYPSQHGAVNATTPLPLDVESVAERFAAAGYRTGAFTGGAFVGPGHRLDQGFEHFDARAERRFAPLGPHLPLVWQLAKNRYAPLRFLVRAVDEYVGLAGVLEAAEAWLAAGEPRPTFLLLHTYQAHDYYLYDADTDDALHAAGPWPSERFARRLSVHPSELGGASQADLDHFRAVYRARIAAIDALFPELLRRIEAQLGPDTLWVVTADHGEGFDAATGRVHHGGRLHEDLLAVPLVLRGPGLVPRVVAEPVRHVDVAPTLLELCGLPALAGAAGSSLVGVLAGAAPPPTLAFAEERAHGLELLAVRSQAWKAIRSPAGIESFELASDPGELVPTDGPAELAAALADFARLFPARQLDEVELDEATQAHLKALGYVE